MPGRFNPYHKWLGIPPEEQPANHYRLLGLCLFEDDLEVVEAAAEQRMAHLRQLHTGKHGELTQQLLNEVAAARLCLLDPDKRGAYDERLRRATTGQPSPPPAIAQEAAAYPIDAHDDTPAGRVLAAASQPRRRWPLIVASAAVLVVVGCLLLIWTLAGSDPAAIAEAGTSAAEPESTSFETPVGGESDPVDATAPPTATEARQLPPFRSFPPAGTAGDAPATPETDTLPADGSSPRPALPRAPHPTLPRPVEDNRPEVAAPQVNQNDRTNDAPTDADRPADAPVASPTKIPRLPVPSTRLQATIRGNLETQHHLAQARSHLERVALAEHLLELSRKVDLRAAERFMLLRLAAEQAASAGDAELVGATIDDVADRFAIDELRVQAHFFTQVVQHANEAPAIESVLERSKMLISAATDDDRYELAEEVAEAAYAVCLRPNGKPYRKEAYDRRSHARGLCERWREVTAALEILKGDPNDADANRTIGQWYCFFKDDWASGLPFLTKTDERSLRELARREVSSRPTTAAEQIELADGWYDVAVKLRGQPRTACLAHARQWYQEARPGLTAAVLIERIDKQIALIDGSAPAPPTGKPTPAPKSQESDAVVVAMRPGTGLNELGGVSWLPRTVQLSPEPFEKLENQPPYQSERPLYGLVVLGQGEDNRFTVVVDGLGGPNPRILVDRNNDEDLTNDFPCGTPNVSATSVFVRDAVVAVPYGDRLLPYAINLHAQRAGHTETLYYYRNVYREGVLKTGDRMFRIAMLDENTDGRFDDLDKGTLLIDLNQDTRLVGASDSAEKHSLAEPFNLHGQVWQVASVSVDGTSLELRPSDAKVEMKRYLTPGNEAPSFAATGLDGEQVDLTAEAEQVKCVLLVFWSSQNVTFRNMCPQLRRLHQQYKHHGLKIIGISLDAQRDQAARLVEQEGLTFPHVFDGAGVRGDVARRYRVHTTPYCYLLDGNLKIIAKRPRDTNLDQRIWQLLGPGGAVE